MCTLVACPGSPTCEWRDTKSDDCNTCTCTEEGTWACTEKDCPEQKDCGGLGGGTCSADEYCAYEPRQLCGADDNGSTCKERPSVCGELYDPVCGCDGISYVNPCSANSAGTGIAYEGDCEVK
jgi:hypothetical protein